MNTTGWIATVAALLLGVSCLWFHGQAVNAKESAATWKMSAEATQQALAEAVEARQEMESALAEHRAKVREVENQSAQLRAKLQEAARHDQTVRDWSVMPLPDAVRGMLQNR